MNNKWLIPAAVLGLGSLGILIATETGLEALSWLGARIKEAPERFLEWNDAAQQELDHLEATLDRMAQIFATAE